AEGAAESTASVTDAAADAESGEGAGEPEDSAGDEQLALVPSAAVDAEAGIAPAGGASVTPEPGQPVDGAAEPAAQTPQADAASAGSQALLQRFMQNQTLVLGTGAVALLVLLLILSSIARRNARREAEMSGDYAPTGSASGAAVGATAAASAD